ncbi:hypothetical protein [Pseudorhodoferax sp.]
MADDTVKTAQVLADIVQGEAWCFSSGGPQARPAGMPGRAAA